MRRSFVLPGLLGIAVVSALAYTLPAGHRQPVVETGVWGLVVLMSFIGYGSLVRAVAQPGAPVDAGLRAAWGAALVCAVGGLLTALSWMTRPVAMAMVDLGVLLALVALVRERARFTHVARLVARAIRMEPLVACAGLVVFGFVVLHYFGAICEWHTNPYDDDIAYLAFLKKLADTGAVDEPFSLRRLSAYGGQTLFLLLVAPRADYSQAHTFDRGIALVMVVLLILGYRTRRRRPPWLFLFLTIGFFVMLPNIAINTASYYSGVVFFFALYRTLVHFDSFGPKRAWQAAVPLALLTMTACTLRQNYVPVPFLMLAVSYAFRVRSSRAAWIERLREPVFTFALSGLLLVPWMYAAYRSNGTFLYPVIRGDANPALSLQSTAMTGVRELGLQLLVAMNPGPVRVLPFLLLAALLLRDQGSRRPVYALLGASFVGTVFVTHAFSQSDPGNNARYSFSFLTSLALAIPLAAFTHPALVFPRLSRATAAAGLCVVAICVQVATTLDKLSDPYKRFVANIDDVRSAAQRSDLTRAPEAGLYERLQNALPSGARVAVMLDEPYYLDFRRNPIWNLDMPGYASLPPGEPFFLGSAKAADYFRGLGVRYIAFVRTEFSRYHYRREYWLQRLSDETELWRNAAPYHIDFIDTLADLANRQAIVFEERGLVVIDLQTPSKTVP